MRGSRIPRLMYDVPMFKALDRSTIKAECDMSLKRLGVDYIDLYYTHSQVIPPVMTTIEETMDALNELKKRKDPCHRRREREHGSSARIRKVGTSLT